MELSHGVRQEKPRALLLGGQTGAGKSVMTGVLTADPHWRQAAGFGSDTLRVHHPDYQRLLATDADTACFYTDPDARAWVGDALDHCVDQRFSVVFDSTMSRQAAAEGFAERFHGAGYRIDAAFVAAPAALSKLGVVARYLDSVEVSGSGRFSPNHDETYDGVLEVARWIDRTAPFDTVAVYRRNGDLLYSNSVDEQGNWVNPPGLRQAIEDERNRPWSAEESDRFLAAVKETVAKVDSVTVDGKPMPPIWLTRVAEAADLGQKLATGPAKGELTQMVLSLRQEASRRVAAASGIDPAAFRIADESRKTTNLKTTDPTTQTPTTDPPRQPRPERDPQQVPWLAVGRAGAGWVSRR
nr:zeta toxin family protein [Kribbella catacumbae]